MKIKNFYVLLISVVIAVVFVLIGYFYFTACSDDVIIQTQNGGANELAPDTSVTAEA